MKKLIIITIALLFTSFIQYDIRADEVNEIRTRIQKAKTNLIMGNLNEAFVEFKALEVLTEKEQYIIPEIKSARMDIIYNLALAYDQKYVRDSSKSINHPILEDLFTSDALFKEISPEIWPDVITMEEENGKKVPELITDGGFVGMVLRAKVKDWLKNKQNCDCRFNSNELKFAENLFMVLTEKEDIAELKDMKVRPKKIREIFSRIKQYIDNLQDNDPINELYDNKLESRCKI